MPGGNVSTPTSFKQFSFERFFLTDGTKPTPEDPRSLLEHWPLKPQYQGETNACVPCTITFIQEYLSLTNAKKTVSLAWEFLYQLSKRESGGVRVDSALEEARTKGICTAKTWEKSKRVTRETLDEAYEYRIGGYTKMIHPTDAKLKAALTLGPVALGVPLHPFDWHSGSKVLYYKYRKTIDHMVALVGFDEKGNRICVSWDSKDSLDVKYLAPDYPILTAYSVISYGIPWRPTMNPLAVIWQNLIHLLSKLR